MLLEVALIKKFLLNCDRVVLGLRRLGVRGLLPAVRLSLVLSVRYVRSIVRVVTRLEHNFPENMEL